jgi:hypothetical protein
MGLLNMIVSETVCSRAQVDLVDLSRRPDGEYKYVCAVMPEILQSDTGGEFVREYIAIIHKFQNYSYSLRLT